MTTHHYELCEIADFARAHPAACRHVVDLPYRLATPAAQAVKNRRLWHDEDGTLQAFALTQLPFWALEYAIAPGAPEGLEREVLAWGIARWAVIARTHDRRWLFVDCPEDQSEQAALLGALGFARHTWQQFHLRQQLDNPPPEPRPPDGFTLRPLSGAGEVEAYVALHHAAFGSENMSVVWRAQTLALPEYRPDLDLVMVAPDGRLAGFCVCWLAQVAGHAEGQVEPMGVHPDFQGCRLGRALLLEGLRRMRAAGARVAHIEVDSENAAAFNLYTSVGYRVERRILKYGMQFG
jgi:ribosomal protein S18 acetylase RimI-like enzyme